MDISRVHKILLKYATPTPTPFSFFQFELLFCFHDDEDPAINLVRQLQEKYPNVEVRLFFSEYN